MTKKALGTDGGPLPCHRLSHDRAPDAGRGEERGPLDGSLHRMSGRERIPTVRARNCLDGRAVMGVGR